MEEKIQEEFVKKSWETDEDVERNEYKENALKMIRKALEKNDLKEIKEIINDLENEIGEF